MPAAAAGVSRSAPWADCGAQRDQCRDIGNTQDILEASASMLKKKKKIMIAKHVENF